MPPTEDENVETIEEETIEEETTEETSEETTTEEDLDEATLKEAKALYKLLSNPTTRNSTLQVLADRAGLNSGKESSSEKKEDLKERKAIKAILTEKLGEKYNFLADLLGPALEEILAGEREETNRQLSTVEVKQVDNEVERALERLSTKTKGESRKVEHKMVQLMDALPKSEKISTYDYLEHLYTIATAGSKTEKTTRQIADKINRNANDATGRLKGASGTGTADETPKKKMSLKESVEFAAKKLKISTS